MEEVKRKYKNLTMKNMHHINHRLTQHYKAGADDAAKNSWSYSQNKQLDEEGGKKIFSALSVSGV